MILKVLEDCKILDCRVGACNEKSCFVTHNSTKTTYLVKLGNYGYPFLEISKGSGESTKWFLIDEGTLPFRVAYSFKKFLQYDQEPSYSEAEEAFIILTEEGY